MVFLNPRLKYLARQMRNAIVSAGKRFFFDDFRVAFGDGKPDMHQFFGVFFAHKIFLDSVKLLRII